MIKSNYAYHMIFMDLHMPVADGEESTNFIREFEKDHSLPRTYIVGLTADVSVKVKNNCLDIGMDDYIAKPITNTRYTNLVYA